MARDESLLGRLRRRVGETGEVLDAGIAWMERQAAQTADMDVPVLSKVADAIVNPALVGARAAIANVTSGGGKYYQPEVRDEKHFSKAALRELGQTVKGMHGRSAGRADGMDSAAQFNLTQTIGGFTVRDGAVTDKFDINKKYHGVPDWMTKTARAVLGAEEDPDAGKVKTRVPLASLQQAAKGGDPDRFSVSRNFLATDEVPETIFGIPVVQREEDYTEEDIAFFREHPEAGGYYDLEDEEEPEEQAAANAGEARDPEGESAEFDEAVKRLREANSNPAEAQKAFGGVVDALKGRFPQAYGELTRVGKDGRFARADERALLMTLLQGAPQYSEASYGRFFYGDKWDEVKSKALKLRGGATLYNAGVSFRPVYGKDAQTIDAKKAADPLKSVFTSGATAPAGVMADKYKAHAAKDSGRAAHWWSTGYSYVPPKGVLSFIHEVFGHGWNPAPYGEGKPQDPARVGKWRGMYYVANDAEFAAEFGNLRKQLFRESYAKYPEAARAKHTPYDIAAPGNLAAFAKSYAANPKKYAFLTENSRAFIDGFNRLMSYGGSDPDVVRRRAEVLKMIGTPDLTNQFVSNGKAARARHAVAKGGKEGAND